MTRQTSSNSINDVPVLGNNTLTISEGETKILTSSNLSASGQGNPETLLFTVSNIQHGQFEAITSPGLAITQFTQQQVRTGSVRFVHDGSKLPPTYQVSVSDGLLSTTPTSAAITFNNNINASPYVAHSLENQQVTVGEPFGLTIPPNTFVDPDHDPLSLSVKLEGGANLPEGMNFDSQTGMLSGTLPNPGTLFIEVAAQDPLGSSASNRLTLTAVPPGSVVEYSGMSSAPTCTGLGAAALIGVLGFFAGRLYQNKTAVQQAAQNEDGSEKKDSKQQLSVKIG